MRRFWPFRNLANFSITIIGATGIGLIYYSISNQRVFSRSPLVSEAVKILGLNDTTRHLLGHPITYTGSFSNTYNIKPEEEYYLFQVKGSKTNTTAELNGKKIKVEELNQKIEKVHAIEENIKTKIAEKGNLIERNGKLKRNQHNQKKVIAEQLNNIETQLKKLDVDLQQARLQKIQTVKKYYIPDDEMYPQVMRGKHPENILNPNLYLYSIDNLVTNLPNKNRVDVIPTPQDKQARTDPKAYAQKNKKYLQVDKITEGYLKDRLKVGIQSLTESELQSYGKHKTTMMYSKHNGYRLAMTFLVTCGVMAAFVFWHVYRITPVGGTLVAHEAEKLFINNSKVGEILKAMKKNKNTIKFSKTFEGGKRNQSFKCSVDVDGIPGGKVYFEGGESMKTGDIKFKSLRFQYKDGKEVKKVDLL